MENIKKNKIIFSVLVICLIIVGLFKIPALKKDAEDNKPLKEYFGSWKVEKYYTPNGIVGSSESYATENEIGDIYKNKIIISESGINVAGISCNNLNSTESRVKTDDFLWDFKVLRNPRNLEETGTRSVTAQEVGIDSGFINLIEYICDEKYYDLIYENSQKGILVYKSTFFFLKR